MLKETPGDLIQNEIRRHFQGQTWSCIQTSLICVQFLIAKTTKTMHLWALNECSQLWTLLWRSYHRILCFELVQCVLPWGLLLSSHMRSLIIHLFLNCSLLLALLRKPSKTQSMQDIVISTALMSTRMNMKLVRASMQKLLRELWRGNLSHKDKNDNGSSAVIYSIHYLERTCGSPASCGIVSTIQKKFALHSITPSSSWVLATWTCTWSIGRSDIRSLTSCSQLTPMASLCIRTLTCLTPGRKWRSWSTQAW